MLPSRSATMSVGSLFASSDERWYSAAHTILDMWPEVAVGLFTRRYVGAKTAARRIAAPSRAALTRPRLLYHGVLRSGCLRADTEAVVRLRFSRGLTLDG